MKFTKIFIAAVALFMGTAAFAQEDEGPKYDVEQDGLLYAKNEAGDAYIVVGYNDDLENEVVIPATVKSLPVTEVAPSAFLGNTEITKVTFGENMVKVRQLAFKNATALVEVVFKGDKVDRAYWETFWGCTSLAKINLDVCTSMTQIDGSAFRSTGLRSVTIPASVTLVDGAAFMECPSLIAVDFAEGTQLEKIGNNAFYSCLSLTSLVIPKTVTEIGDEALFNTGMTEYTVEEGNEFYTVEDGMLYSADKTYLIQCPVLKELGDYMIPAGVTTLGSRCFGKNETLTSVIIPNTVTTLIGASHFNQCANLETITFEEGAQITSLSNFMFQNCPKITTFTVPASVMSIGNQMFGWSAGVLEELTFEEGSQLLTIGDLAFRSAVSLPVLDLRNCTYLQSIGDDCFMGCVNLKEVYFPQSLTTFSGRRHFNGCTALETVYFEPGSQATYFSNFMFQNCPNLRSITIPAAVKYIGQEAFGWTGTIENIEFEAGSQLENIGDGAFRAGAFTEIDLSGCHKLSTVSTSAFKACPQMKRVYLPASCINFGGGAFMNNPQLDYIVWSFGGDWNDETDGVHFLYDSTNVFEGDDCPCYINADATNVPEGCQSLTMVAVPSMKINAEGYGTYYNAESVIMPTQVTGSIVTGVADNALVIDEAYDTRDEVPAGTALLVRGAEGIYTPVPCADNTDEAPANLLKGTAAETKAEGDVVFKLDGANFVVDAEYTCPANQAYLALTAAQAGEVTLFPANGETGATDGIENITVKPLNRTTGIFNLAGQRVTGSANGYKGIVIINGKKLIRK